MGVGSDDRGRFLTGGMEDYIFSSFFVEQKGLSILSQQYLMQYDVKRQQMHVVRETIS